MMRILPVSFGFKKLQNNVHTKNVSSPVLNYKADTVTFSGKMTNIAEQNLEELETIFNEEIAPFMSESKDLYMSVGKIGYASQEALKVFGKKSTELMQHQLELTKPENNSNHAKFEKLISRMNQYQENLRTINHIESMAEQSMYNVPELRQKMDSAKVLYSDNSEIEKIRPLCDAYNHVYQMISEDFENLSLKNADTEMAEKLSLLKELNTQSMFYMIVTPYSESVKLQKNMKDIKKSFDDPNVNLFTKLKNIEKAQKTAYNILKSKELFYENKTEIENFVTNHKDYKAQFPSEIQITKAYDRLIDNSNLQFKERISLADDLLKKEYENNGVIIDFEDIDKTLELQKKANDEMFGIIDNIKSEYISKQNEEYFKKYNPNGDF